jgi:hypothetical protein
MNLTIQLAPEIEAKLRKRADRSGKTIEEFVVRLAEEAVAADPKVLDPRDKSPEAIERWITEFRAWAASHKATGVIADDSRDSIYEGRGE